jgi:anti-anti-sigma factor
MTRLGDRYDFVTRTRSTGPSDRGRGRGRESERWERRAHAADPTGLHAPGFVGVPWFQCDHQLDELEETNTMPTQFPAFGVEVNPDDEEVLRVKGEVDLATAQLLAEHLDAVIESGIRSVIVDLEETTFIDSSGLSVIVRALTRLRAHDGDMVLRSPTGSVRRSLEITGLDKLLAVV